MEHAPLKICLDARLISGLSGGIQQTVIGLASGFSNLTDGNEQYYFLVYPRSSEWLYPYIDGPCRLLQVPMPPQRKLTMFFESLPYSPRWIELLRRHLHKILRRLPASPGIISNAGIDVMHFTFQSAFVTDLPCIYQVHDLQHEHYPQFFTKGERDLRNFRYRMFCQQASLVPVFFKWMKDELVRLYQVPYQKIPIIPWAPVVDAYPDISQDALEEIQEKFSLPKNFVFFPAQTFQHKNHIKLIEALWRLKKEKNLTIPLICTGTQTNFFSNIQSVIQRLGMRSHIRFLGFISPVELIGIYRSCTLMVFPSLYEGWGLPVTEALRLKVPIAASALPSLKEQAQDGALYFDPATSYGIMVAIERLWTDANLRATVVKCGQAAVNRYNWETTTRMFRAQYRRLINSRLTDDDRFWLQQSSVS